MTLYFDCPETAEPIGGIKQIYRQVDVLNARGIGAAIVHATPGFRCTWFPNDTIVTYAKDLTPSADDLLVVPECRPPGELQLVDLFPALRRVVFNQNCYLTFKDVDPGAGIVPGYRSVYEDPGTLAIVTVSEDSAVVLRDFFPWLDVHVVRCGIDDRVFRFAADKDPVVAYTVRKNKLLREVVQALRIRGSLNGYEVVPIQNMPQHRVAAVMRRAHVFLTAFNYEGFGLPPAEAMASGCVVIGFDGRGGREYFTPDTGYPVPSGDLGRFVRTAADVLAQIASGAAEPDQIRRRAAAFVAAEYSLDREADSIARAWEWILAKHRIRAARSKMAW